MRFRRLCELEPRVTGCDCHSLEGFACPACAEYRELLLALRAAFRIRAWDQFHCDYEPPIFVDARAEIRWWAEALEEALEESRVELES